MVAMDETDEHNVSGKTHVWMTQAVLIENEEKNCKEQEGPPVDGEITQEDQGSDEEYLDMTQVVVIENDKKSSEEEEHFVESETTQQDSEEEFLETTLAVLVENVEKSSKEQEPPVEGETSKGQETPAESDMTQEDRDSKRGQETPCESETTQEDQDSEQEDLELAMQLADGNPSPAEIKRKIIKSLLEFRCKVEDAIRGNYLLGEPNKKLSSGEMALAREQLRNVTLWGVPLLPSKAHEGTDVVLRKFLKARDFKVQDAFDMLQKTMIWRRENNIDRIVGEDFDSGFESVGWLNGWDREGRPVCYHVTGIFKDKHVYKETFGTQQKREKYFRWRIQLMEKCVRKLSFREGEADSMVHIYDLKNTAAQGMKELNSISKKILVLYQNHYPELIHKNIVVNAPFWFYTSQVLFSRFMNQRNKKKFILARSQRVTHTLLKFLAPEHLPVEYGGLKRKNDEDFSPADQALEHKIRGSRVSTIKIPVNEPGVTITWDVTVVGWEYVSYKEEFVPDDEGSYKILLQNQSRVGDSTRNSFYINEPGNIVIKVENGAYKRKKMFYRSKTRTTIPEFIIGRDR